MPPPPKWHLKELDPDEKEILTPSIFLCSDNGEPIKHPTTNKPFGRIVEACQPKEDKYGCEGITVSKL